jgi:hypothetical protein
MTTQEKRIFDHLQKFGTITNAQAHNDYGIRHLPSVIRDIKKHYNITIYDWWKEGKNRFDEHCRWKVYSIYEQKTA